MNFWIHRDRTFLNRSSAYFLADSNRLETHWDFAQYWMGSFYLWIVVCVEHSTIPTFRLRIENSKSIRQVRIALSGPPYVALRKWYLNAYHTKSDGDDVAEIVAPTTYHYPWRSSLLLRRCKHYHFGL